MAALGERSPAVAYPEIRIDSRRVAGKLRAYEAENLKRLIVRDIRSKI